MVFHLTAKDCIAGASGAFFLDFYRSPQAGPSSPFSSVVAMQLLSVVLGAVPTNGAIRPITGHVLPGRLWDSWWGWC